MPLADHEAMNHALLYRVVVSPHGGGYVARSPDVPGAIAFASDAEECVHALRRTLNELVERASRVGEAAPPASDGAVSFEPA